MQDVLRIGQVCKLYGLSLDTLRYYDKIGLLKPYTDPQNHYRYYALEQLDVLEWILMGKLLETPLQEVKETIQSENIGTYIETLAAHKKAVAEKRQQLEKRERYLESLLDTLDQMQHFETDWAFATPPDTQSLDVEIVQISLEKLLECQADFLNEYGVETLQQWGLYTPGQPPRMGISLAQPGAVPLPAQRLQGTFARLSFKGTQARLEEYIGRLTRHFDLLGPLAVQYHYALLHENMQHEYFADIFFAPPATSKSAAR